MDYKESGNHRLYVLAGFLAVVLLIYLGVLYDIQINDHDYYLTKSVNTIAKKEKVEASRGIITDRSGRPLVSNRSTYSLTFDSSLLKDGEDQNDALLRLLELCREQGVDWMDNLPITRQAPFSFTVDTVSSTQKSRFLSYLKDLKPAREALTAYLLAHPEVVGDTEEASDPGDAVSMDSAALLNALKAEHLTTRLLSDAGITVAKLAGWMRESFKVPAEYTQDEARLVLGVQYELAIRKLDVNEAYVLAEDISTEFISLINDGGYSGAKVTSSFVRKYETTYAAHILGTVGSLYKEDLENPLYADYPMNATVGKEGVELAFEQYLHGTDGTRIVSTNSEGKVTGVFYEKEPQPGNTVELTIDLELQKVVEDALEKTVSAMNEEDGNTARGAAAVVEAVGTGEILSIASYPTYDLSTYRQNYAALEADPSYPMLNRATQGGYAPGSTLKPLTAIAALEEGVIEPYQKLNSPVTWYYPGDPNSYAKCWYRSGSHGLINITQAITLSCNYFFAEMGYRLGLDTLNEYVRAFGLGEHTGIEIGDRTGNLTENKPGENLAPWAAFGQADYLFTPIQLANYIATLVSGGKRCDAHLMKAVKTYDNTEVVALGNTEPQTILDISAENLEAVKQGMLGYTQPGGMVYSYFKDCVVSAGAKTGTAQLGANVTNNGVFVCFAPYEDPEIVISIVIEQGGAGAALASTAVEILNAYFTPDEIGTTVIGENQLLQ